jgi:anti-sigma regulatory factor (Ser/Thr protein kinase)
MSDCTYNISDNFDHVYAHKLISAIRLEKPTSVLLDWSNCHYATNIALCLVLNLMFELEQEKIGILHISDEANDYYTKTIYPFISFPAQELIIRESTLGAFLAGVEDETILSRVMSMKEYLRSLRELDLFNINPLETIFSELYMNICQHSWKSHGIAFVAIEPQNHIIELIISDIGVGIPANIKESFSEFEDKSDAEAILYATEDMITTKSIEQNYGKGLNNLKTSITALNGSAVIYSGYGGLAIESPEVRLEKYDEPINGTQIHIRIDFRNFDERGNFDFTEDIEF